MVEAHSSVTAADGDISMASVADIIRSAGMLLRHVRLARGLHLGGPARLCGVSVSEASRLERGNRTPRLDYLIRLSAILGVRPSDVLRMAEDEVFPLGLAPWADHPSELLSAAPHVVATADKTLRNCAAGGDA